MARSEVGKAIGLGLAPIVSFLQNKMLEHVMPSLFNVTCAGASYEDLSRWADDGGPVVGDEGPILWDDEGYDYKEDYDY